MRNDTQTDLDLLFKEGLEDARVKAPRGAWKAVSARLADAAPAAAAATPKRSRLLWGVPAFAFAAAAIAAVFFIGTTEKTIIKSGESILTEVEQQSAPVAEAAQAPAAQTTAAPLAQAAATPRKVDSPSRAGFVPREIQTPDQITVLPAENHKEADSQPAQQEAAAGSEVEKAESPKVSSESESETAKPEANGEDYFAKLEAEDAAAAKSTKRKTAIKVGGTVGGNDAHFNGLAHPAYSSGGPYAGVTETSVSVYGIPVSAGISGRFHITDKFAVSAGFSWSLLTRTFAGKYKTAEGDVTHTMQYIGIPLSVSYDLIDSRTMMFYCYAGGSAEKAISSKYYIYADSTAPLYTEKVQSPQFGVFGGIGVEFRLSDHLGLYADPSVKYWFPGNQPKSIRTDKPLMFSLEAGLRFNF